MAAIDKIYGSTEQYDEFYSWISKNRPEYLRYFYPRDGYPDMDRPITNLSVAADAWIYKHCPLAWVVQRISEQYNGREPGKEG